MNGLERTRSVFAGRAAEPPPVLPMVHTGLARAFGTPLGDFFTSAETMAEVMVRGCREFRFDGVQLSLGVTGEAEALGARVELPPDGAPVLRQHLLGEGATLGELRCKDVTAGGRMPLFFEAVARVVEAIGREGFVLATLRGPLLIGSQLRGVKQILLDMLDDPAGVEEILDYAVDLGLALGAWLRPSGAHGVLLGEATCSPSFISPDLYRDLVLTRHRRLVAGLKEQGWEAAGLHICGNTRPILEDVIATGVDFMDLDYQVPASDALETVAGRIVLRGNLDPSSVFRYGSRERVASATRELCRAVRGHPWILSSGCDIPPGTPAENLGALATAAHDTAG
jgi:uroporphyrinogen decarboxylase